MDVIDLPKKMSGRYTTTYDLIHAYVAKNEANVIDYALSKEKHRIKVIYPTDEELAPFPQHVRDSIRAYIALETKKLVEMV